MSEPEHIIPILSRVFAEIERRATVPKQREPSQPFELRPIVQGSTGLLLDTGSERAVCFEHPEMPRAWRLWKRGADGRWQPHGPWVWHHDEYGEAA